jgi:hypothetical protein
MLYDGFSLHDSAASQIPIHRPVVAVELRLEEGGCHGEDDFMRGKTRLLHAIRRLILYLYNEVMELHAVEVVLKLFHLGGPAQLLQRTCRRHLRVLLIICRGSLVLLRGRGQRCLVLRVHKILLMKDTEFC